MNRMLSTILVLALLGSAAALQAKVTSLGGAGRYQILQLPGGMIDARMAKMLDDQLCGMIQDHNNNLGDARSKFNGVDYKGERIDITYYGSIGKRQREELRAALKKMIRDHNRRIEQALKQQQQQMEQNQQMQMQLQQQQQQMQMQQQQFMYQQQQQQMQMQQQEMMRRQQEQQRMAEEQRRQQEEQQRRLQYEQRKKQEEAERQERAIPRRIRGRQGGGDQ